MVYLAGRRSAATSATSVAWRAQPDGTGGAGLNQHTSTSLMHDVPVMYAHFYELIEDCLRGPHVATAPLRTTLGKAADLRPAGVGWENCISRSISRGPHVAIAPLRTALGRVATNLARHESFGRLKTTKCLILHMPNTYSRFYVHYVTAVKYRRALIEEQNRMRAQEYIGGLLRGRGHGPQAVYCNPDHVHILFRARMTDPICTVINQLKTNSSREFKRWIHPDFAWQSGGGLFSVSRWDVPKVERYIENQFEHHQQQTFIEEFKELLSEHDIVFEEQYLLEEAI